MNSFCFLAALALLAGFGLITFGVARLADGDCRSFLTAWAEESGMTLLRCRRCWLILEVEAPCPMRVLYRLTAVDRQGRLRTGWASVTVKFWGGEIVARSVEVRWTRVRQIPRPTASPSCAAERPPLWDHWIDG